MTTPRVVTALFAAALTTSAHAAAELDVRTDRRDVTAQITSNGVDFDDRDRFRGNNRNEEDRFRATARAEFANQTARATQDSRITHTSRRFRLRAQGDARIDTTRDLPAGLPDNYPSDAGIPDGWRDNDAYDGLYGFDRDGQFNGDFDPVDDAFGGLNDDGLGFAATAASTLRIVFDLDNSATYRATASGSAGRGPAAGSSFRVLLRGEDGTVFRFRSRPGDPIGSPQPDFFDVGVLGAGRYTLIAQAVAAGEGAVLDAASFAMDLRITLNPTPAAAVMGVSCLGLSLLRRDRRTTRWS